MKIYNMKQQTDEWFEIRLGKFTASNFSSLFSNKSTLKYQSVINDVVYERLTGLRQESFSNQWMERGNELESEARQSYEMLKFQKVKEIGFVELNNRIGCSPDGFVGDNGMIEIKCPKASTLISLHSSEKIKKDHYWQIQGQMWICKKQWCDYYVYHPELPAYIKRLERNDDDIKRLENEINEAIELVKTRIKKIRSEK